MPLAPVLFIDTSVLCHLLRVPGRCSRADEREQTFRAHLEKGVRFILPITAIIETGNFIQQCGGDRHSAAGRFREALRVAAGSDPPWLIHQVDWDATFIANLVSGDSTGTTLVEHLGKSQLGAGDLSILVERDLFRLKSSFTSVGVWTTDEKLSAYASY